MSVMTKKALASTLKSMMERSSLEKITVKDLVTECGVNRQTFYYHFQDIYDLLGWIYKTEALDAISNCRTYDTWQQGFLKIFHYVLDNKKFCLSTYRSMGREHLDLFLHQAVFDLLMGVIEEVNAGKQVRAEDKKFIANFYTFAFIGIMLEWIRNGMGEEPSLIIDRLSILVEGDVEKAISKYVHIS
ncbi:TetR/AcrR family transcriptional regulator [Paenibacillus motobuensis]|uniref:TetR/AcrR family transcriptional regulator n=1 Tax=Paenibacillus TaxID=44249 RepID=UPI00203C4059|nr:MULTISPECIES: TetR/AcrR family transcriptional regulator [Paenibacillus]MCM3039367.1 TetR/AcrR family transcriptional regulator [Paenibacillus lutimineralis]MCM3646471.1 TetR/AcrR family transcriptional regulator [Paenibacillus motobuensis]